MEIIGVDSESYKDLMKKIDYITDFIINQEKPDIATSVDETWVYNYEICTFLRISERTLQRLRSSGQVLYS